MGILRGVRYSVRPGWNFLYMQKEERIGNVWSRLLWAELEREGEDHPDREGRIHIPITLPWKGNRYKRPVAKKVAGCLWFNSVG